MANLDPGAGLCSACAHVRQIRNNRGSVFLLCRRGDTDPRFSRYPPLPVTRCSGFEPRGKAADCDNASS